jgi:transcriptional regulator with XRE-family HTH domain
MNVDISRLRREVADELARVSDVGAQEVGDLDPAFAELRAKILPDAELIDLLLADAPALEVDDGFAERQARRIPEAIASLDALAEPVGDLLARHRRERNLSVEQVARRLGVAADVLAQIEQGRAPARLLGLPVAKVRELASTLGIPHDRFVLSVTRSIPRPDGFVFAYRPRRGDQEAEPARVISDDGERLARWVADYLA